MTSHSIDTISVHKGTILDEKSGGNPRYFNAANQKALAERMSALENAESALIFSSGMAAISTTLLALLSHGDHIVFQKGLYGGTFKFIHDDFHRFGIQFTITENNTISDFKKAILPNTKAIFIESPSNPLLQLTDIAQVAGLTQNKNIISIIDSTFASPVNQNPIDLGIDIVIHSATKYLGGHSDLTAGAIVSSQTNIDHIRNFALNLGGSLNPEMCYILERSLKTIALRVKKQNENALQLVDYLDANEYVKRVYYPGLESHTGHSIAKKQMRGFGGMLSFELNNLDGIEFQRNLSVIKPAVSLGGVESTICTPSITSHRHMKKVDREREGITDSLLRLSVGIEGVDDLIGDIDNALNKILPAKSS
jgi:cystathionine beta-lyase